MQLRQNEISGCIYTVVKPQSQLICHLNITAVLNESNYISLYNRFRHKGSIVLRMFSEKSLMSYLLTCFLMILRGSTEALESSVPCRCCFGFYFEEVTVSRPTAGVCSDKHHIIGELAITNGGEKCGIL